MSKDKSNQITATMKARAFPRHGELYRWLLKNHRLVEAGFKATGAGWDGLAAVVKEAGVAGRFGAAPNERSVRKVWLRVCADIEAAAAVRAAAGKRRRNRSRSDSNWQPPLAEPPRTAPALPYRRYEPEEELPPRRPSALPPTQAPPATSKPMTIDDLTPEARAKIDRVKAELAEEDRKRFGRF
jgi:hypothetical protein